MARRRKDDRPVVNLLDLVPERKIDFEVIDEERVVLLAPRFRLRWLRRIFEPRMKNPFVRVRLDEVGSAVWLACDGKTNVGRIASLLRDRFGEKIEPCHDRLAMFLHGLERGRLLDFPNLEECRERAEASSRVEGE
jgi:hypothetical protein